LEHRESQRRAQAAAAAAGVKFLPLTTNIQENYMATQSERPVLYAGTGLSLTQYDIDVDAATLTKRSVTTLPASTQYAWQHRSRKYLYLAASNSGSGAVQGAPGNT